MAAGYLLLTWPQIPNAVEAWASERRYMSYQPFAGAAGSLHKVGK